MLTLFGPHGITTEMLVAAGEVGILELTELSNMIHNQGCFPSELNKSIFITQPKVNGTIKCENNIICLRFLDQMVSLPRCL